MNQRTQLDDFTYGRIFGKLHGSLYVADEFIIVKIIFEQLRKRFYETKTSSGQLELLQNSCYVYRIE